jgi:hypothetical protein
MSASYLGIAAPLVLTLATACATRTTQPVATAPATAVPRSNMVYVTGSRLGIPSTGSGRTQGAQPVQSVGQQEITQSGQTNVSDAMNFLVPITTVSAGGMTGGK